MHGKEKFAYFVKKIKSVGYMILGVVPGLTPYLLLPIRSVSSAPVVWGDASTLDGFFWMVSGRMYQDNLFPTLMGFPEEGIQRMIGLLSQFGFLGIPLMVLGILPLRSNKPLAWITLSSFITYFIFSISYVVVDSYVYLIPVIVVMAIWLGKGVSKAMNIATKNRTQWISRLIGIVLILGYIGHLIQYWDQVDASHDFRAEKFGMEVLKTLPAQSLVITNGDRSTFSLWYFHFALGRRPDIRLVASDLISFDWYRNRLQKIYPDISVPQKPDPVWIISFEKQNPDRQICHVYYTHDAYIYCGTTKNP